MLKLLEITLDVIASICAIIFFAGMVSYFWVDPKYYDLLNKVVGTSVVVFIACLVFCGLWIVE